MGIFLDASPYAFQNALITTVVSSHIAEEFVVIMVYSAVVPSFLMLLRALSSSRLTPLNYAPSTFFSPASGSR